MSGFRHDAALYDGADEFVAAVVPFVQDGRSAGEPVMVAVPAPRLALLRSALGAPDDAVRFADMSELGRNPARIIPAVESWVADHGGRACRFVSEPIWTGRSADEIAEAARHESLLNLAFADVATSILCPYDRARLDAAVLDAVPCSHHATFEDGVRHTSLRYAEPAPVFDIAEWPLTAPPASAWTVEVTPDLTALRTFVRERVGGLLSPLRMGDLLIAANEAATNALRHGRRPAVLRLWHDDAEVVCEVCDGGRIADPLVGRRLPPVEQHGGRGLWLVHQLCDLSQLRSGPSGTFVRMHMALE